MKILYITGSLPPLKCGVGFYSEKILGELSKRANVKILTTSGVESSHKLYTYKTGDWKINKIGYLYGVCKKAEADCYVIQYPARGYKRNLGINLIPYVIRFIIRKPVTVTLHEYHGSGILGKLRNTITIIPANKVFVSNEYDFLSLPEFIRKKTIIIPIGSNITRDPNPSLYTKILRENKFSTAKKTGVFFGFPNQNKGLDTLLKSVEESNSQLLIVAGIDKKNEYHNYIAQEVVRMNNKGIKVHITGYLPDNEVSSVLNGADYFIMPQPLPLTAKSGTAIAAAVHGTPIVSTGSNDKRLNYPYVNGENSILLNPMNCSSLTKTLDDINNNRVDLGKISKNLLSLSRYFDWQRIASKYIHEISEVVN